jgi:hypothetical protein
MIKIINKRNEGSLFHYAHFICDCLFPEIINDIYKYEEVVRQKNINQTIGNFNKIYTEVLMIKNTELLQNDFDNLNIETVIYKKKEEYLNKLYFEKFRNFIFERYKINSLEYDEKYPKVILIKRYGRVELIDDEYLKNINNNVTTGKERREINNIDKVEEYLKNKYNDDFKSIHFEHISFEEQVKYFNNAKLIICAHGAVMSNMFFCKENTKIIEITCGSNWEFFNQIPKILNLKHIKCFKNQLNDVVNCIELNSL